jgi:hypothetical protein
MGPGVQSEANLSRPHSAQLAISVNTVTSFLGEILAPFVFYMLTRGSSLTPAMFVAGNGALHTAHTCTLHTAYVWRVS